IATPMRRKSGTLLINGPRISRSRSRKQLGPMSRPSARAIYASRDGNDHTPLPAALLKKWNKLDCCFAQNSLKACCRPPLCAGSSKSARPVAGSLGGRTPGLLYSVSQCPPVEELDAFTHGETVDIRHPSKTMATCSPCPIRSFELSGTPPSAYR